MRFRDPVIPRIAYLEEEKVVLQYQVNAFTSIPAREILDAIANEGCRLHGKMTRVTGAGDRDVPVLGKFTVMQCWDVYEPDPQNNAVGDKFMKRKLRTQRLDLG